MNKLIKLYVMILLIGLALLMIIMHCPTNLFYTSSTKSSSSFSSLSSVSSNFNMTEIHLKETKIYNVTYFGDPRRTSFTTVVTTLFQFGKSKHTADKYEKWSSTMIRSLGSPIVAFVDYNWAQKFIDKCKQNNVTAKVYITQSIWDIMSELELARHREYTKSYREKQLSMDGERSYHSPELYAVWNLKNHLMKKVANLNPFKSHFFIYTDSGAWRERTYTDWPDVEFNKLLTSRLGDRILYGQIGYPDMEKFNPFENLIEGTFFAGSSEAIFRIYAEFYELHDEWLDQGRFVGKDQILMNVLAFERAKSMIVRLRTAGLNCTSSYDIWFFYQSYFAQPSEYVCLNDRLSILLESSKT